MATFIKLHETFSDGSTREVRVCLGQGDDYYAEYGGTWIARTSGGLQVTETPEQIDAMLGVTDGWRTIESAPKDGSEVLLWLGAPWSRVEKARWYEPWGNWQCGSIPADPVREEMHGIGSAVPTHWQPVPNPPASGE